MPNLVSINRANSLWTSQDINLYNRLPIYMAKIQVDYMKHYSRWPKMLKNIKWQPNMGFTMQGVHKNPSPVLRSQVIPNPITSAPLKDVIEIRESSEQVQLYRHNFESNLFHFLPSFVDFLTDSIDKTMEDITEKMAIFVDQFYRTAIFHGSPYVYVCGKPTELTAAPTWTSPTITLAKTQAWLQAQVATCTKTLGLNQLQKISQVFLNDIGATPFSGSMLADGTNGDALKYKFCLITSSEVWDNFINDSFLQGNRQLNLDIVTDGFTGSLFGRWTTMFERYELRIAADGSIPAPEVTEENPAAFDFGEVKPNPPYVNAPYGVAFGCGGEGFKSIQVGPPPRDFQGMSNKEFALLNWNGKVDITQNVLVPSRNSDNAEVIDTNKRGEYLQMISDGVMGILPIRRRNLLPIIYLRSRVGT